MPPRPRRGVQRHHDPSASSRSPVRARREGTQEPTAPRAETAGMMAQRHEDRTTTMGDGAPCPKKSATVRSGQCRGVTRQGDMSKRPDVCGETNGPPTRHWSTATDVRAAGFLSGTRPPSPRAWAIHDHLTQATAAGGGTWMFLRRRARLRL